MSHGSRSLLKELKLPEGSGEWASRLVQAIETFFQRLLLGPVEFEGIVTTHSGRIKKVTRLTGGADYQVSIYDHVVIVKLSPLTAFTVRLPLAPEHLGHEIEIWDGSGQAASTPIAIAAPNGFTVNGAASVALSTNFGRKVISFDGDQYLAG